MLLQRLTMSALSLPHWEAVDQCMIGTLRLALPKQHNHVSTVLTSSRSLLACNWEPVPY